MFIVTVSVLQCIVGYVPQPITIQRAVIHTCPRPKCIERHTIRVTVPLFARLADYWLQTRSQTSITCRCDFYRAMHYSAKRVLAIACRPSVRLSVTLMDCYDIGWNFSKIISRLVSLGCSLSADPNVTGLLQGEHPEIFARMGMGCGKNDFWRTKAVISLKRGKIGYFRY